MSQVPAPSIRIVISVVITIALATATAGCSGPSDQVKPGSLAKKASLKGRTFTVGSKEFTEQLILCHITSLALRSAGATVDKQCGVQGSNSTRIALISGSIDMYWEYTGTAWVNYLKHANPLKDPAELYQAVEKEDLAQNHIKWLAPALANNTYAIAVKPSTAAELKVIILSDYAKLVQTNPAQASMCVAKEFAGRQDGLPGLEKAYGFTVPRDGLATVDEGDPIFDAIAKGKPCNFGVVTTTDGRISARELTVLQDDKQFFPVYNPALTVRESVYMAYPGLAKIIYPIALALTNQVLQQLTGAVDLSGKDAATVAEAWLQDKGFIGR